MNAVLALNSGKNEFGELSRETTDRIDAAMQFAIGQTAGVIIMVGGDALSMSDYATEHFPGLPRPLAEGESKDTLEGAHIVKVDFLKPSEWHDIDIFTNDFHAPRTDWTYSRVLGGDYHVTMHSVASNYLGSEKLGLVRRREQLQLAVARLKLLGIAPEEDDKRAERLAHLRFRGRDNVLSRMLVRADGFFNVKRC